jgi:hypothetical protein
MAGNVIFHSLMSTHRQTRANAITLTISALLGLGALAGCSGNGAPPAATLSPSQTRPSAGSAAAPAPAAKTAPALLHDTLAALRSGGSVHVDISSSTPDGSIVYSDDATANGGRQIATVDKTGHVTILFIAGVGYVKADANGLADLFQLAQPQADQFAGQWIALRPGDKLGLSTYDDVTAGITLSSVASELQPSGGTTKLAAPATIAGQRVLALQEPLPASSQFPATARNMLYMTDNSLLRPVLSEVTNAGSYKYQVSFSHWGETLHLNAPANAIPATSVTPASSVT